MTRSLVSPCAYFVRRCNTTTASRVSSSLGISSGNHAVYRNTRVEVHTARVVTDSTSSSFGGSISNTFIAFPRPLAQPLHPSTFSLPQYPREIVFLVGAPGAGKGTHSLHIANQRNFSAPTIVVSDLLNTPACKLLKDHGIMVDDNFVFNALLAELQKPIYRNGVVVDGFPRTAAQAKFLTDFYFAQPAGMPFQYSPNIKLVMLHVDETMSIERQLARGRRLSLENEQCAAAGRPLQELRQTDLEYDAAKARYQVFEAQNEAVIALSHTFPLITVDASINVRDVRTNLSKQLVSMS